MVKDSDELDVFFQSAQPAHEPLTEQDYTVDKVSFEGIGQARKRRRNVMAISDFGHYISGLSSSYYCGAAKVNYCQKIGAAIDTVINRLGICHSKVVLIGSSAGADGALLAATYMHRKVTVIAVNPWIMLHDIVTLSNYLATAYADVPTDKLVERYGARLNATARYKEASMIPVLSLVLNKNDKQCFHRGMSFVNSCAWKFQRLKVDIYDGPKEHIRPPKEEYLRKIEEARIFGHEELMNQGMIAQYKKNKGSDLFAHIVNILLMEKCDRAYVLRDFGRLAMDCKKLNSAERLFRAALKEQPSAIWIQQLLEQVLALQAQKVK